MRRSLLPALSLALLLSFAAPAPAADDWVVRESSSGVEETVARLEEAIARSGSLVLAVFDHRAAAGEIGIDLPPATVVLFAKPRTSSPLIAENPRAAMDMPQKILVWEEDGGTYAGFVAPSTLVSRHGIAPGHPELQRLHAAMDALVSAAVRRMDERTAEGH